MKGGLSPYIPVTIPESIKIYSLNLSLLSAFFVNLLTSVQLGHISKCGTALNNQYCF